MQDDHEKEEKEIRWIGSSYDDLLAFPQEPRKFAAHPALRHPQTRSRVACFDTDKGGAGYKENLVLEGPLVVVFEKTLEAIARNK